jgi:hypothetical protein
MREKNVPLDTLEVKGKEQDKNVVDFNVLMV